MSEAGRPIIRILGPEDLKVFWPVRLLALKESPEAFGASYEESKKLAPEDVVKRLSPPNGGFVLGAFDRELVGVTGFARQDGLKGRHKGTIWGVYVVPQARGRGIARAMMEEALRRCRMVDGLEEVMLAVATTNKPARSLYKSLGFEAYGIEPRALKIENQYIDEELLVLKL